MLQTRINTDKIGAGLSLLCLVHCLATAIFVGFIPVLAMTEDFHAWLLIPLIPVAMIAIYDATCIHKTKPVAIIILSGILLISVSTLMFHGSLYEYPGMIAGSLLLIAGHSMNHKKCRQCDHPHNRA